MNRHNYLKFLEIQAKVRAMPDFNKTPLQDLHKLDKEQLINIICNIIMKEQSEDND